MSCIFKGDSIYKSGGGGGFKNAGEVITDGNVIDVENNSFITIDNYDQSAFTVNLITEEDELPYSVITVNNEIDSVIKVTVNGDEIAINSGSSNNLVDGTQYQITVMGDAYTVTGLVQQFDIPAAYKRVQYHLISGNGDPVIQRNAIREIFHLNECMIGDYLKIKIDIVYNNLSSNQGFEFEPYNYSANNGTNSISFMAAKEVYVGYPYFERIQYDGVYNTPGYQKKVEKEGLPSMIDGMIHSVSQWSRGQVTNWSLAMTSGSSVYDCGNRANLKSYIELFLFNKIGTADISVLAGTKIHYVKVTGKMNLLPVVRIGDGKVGFYDTVTGNFCYPSRPGGDTSLTPGPDYV